LSNSFFQFKQFRIEQGQCAMKVCTDSCLFGALIKPKPEVKYILDIGTGTGLLALMLAQKTEAEIDAVEIDPLAAGQADENIQQSKWRNRIKIHEQSIQEFSLNAGKKYDLIISNPPFFNNYLKSPDIRINMAHHNESLSLEELIACVANLLTIHGTFAVMLPTYESLLLEQQVEKLNLHLIEKYFIQDRQGSETTRVISLFSFDSSACREHQINIKNGDSNYSSEFHELLADYYLHL
jgi:tRNA1Val (adenine37-N6)-methyltransferase